MTFSDKDIYEAVKHHLPTVNEYVNSHGGSIELLGTKEGVVYIVLTGTCHGCSMSLMTTKMVVERKLRELIHPELVVTNIDGSAENILPETYYKEETPKEETPKEETAKDETSKEKSSAEGLVDKVKNLF